MDNTKSVFVFFLFFPSLLIVCNSICFYYYYVTRYIFVLLVSGQYNGTTYWLGWCLGYYFVCFFLYKLGMLALSLTLNLVRLLQENGDRYPVCFPDPCLPTPAFPS